ncbi:MAG: CIA30 family protein [Spirochaetales bacterium]|uniref:CIA30 family protein n=1 Tax=Candidatus Thalassospirochaeta sargassi TaxID=3119039 RepID=A0AAJ1MJ46_9SPIO|nr:CIA30 family protein [Spirochaetales bacterium]
MNKKVIRGAIMIIIISLSTAGILFGKDNSPNYLSLHDFNTSPENNSYEWTDFTDQVMGGKSEGATSLMQEDGEFFLRLSGTVSLENNGGFIQSRLKFVTGLNVFNASEYDGVRVLVRGKGSGYYLFFRTSATLFPWLYYSAPIGLSEEWQEIDIPWSAIKKGDFGRPGRFNSARLKSIALVAYGREFTAEVDLKQIGLYKN